MAASFETLRPFTRTVDFLETGRPIEEVLRSIPHPVPIEVARAACNAVGSHQRLDVVMHLAEIMREKLWLRLLGEEWSSFDNVWAYEFDLWPRLAGVDTGEMMTRAERVAFEALPDAVTIYRGCGSVNRNGICWSLDRGVAERFPTLNRYRVPDPVLLTATVKRGLIVALKLDREEWEVITFDAEIVAEESLLPERLTA